MENQRLETEEAEWDDTVPKDTWRNYAATGRLAVILAGVTFCALFFPLMDEPWGLPLATLAGYSVLVFSLAFRDKNCSLHRPQVKEQLPKFALMHLPFLLMVYAIEIEWKNVALSMPSWLTVRGRKGSFYEWIVIALLRFIGWAQQKWMRSMVKRRLTERGHERLE